MSDCAIRSDLDSGVLPASCERETTTADRTASLAVYAFGLAHAMERGLILADTQFKFGICDGTIRLIDEVLTPDSARDWRITGQELSTLQVLGATRQANPRGPESSSTDKTRREHGVKAS